MKKQLSLDEVKNILEDELRGKIPLYHTQLSGKRISDVNGNVNLKQYLVLKYIVVESYHTDNYRVLKPYKKHISKVLRYD